MYSFHFAHTYLDLHSYLFRNGTVCVHRLARGKTAAEKLLDLLPSLSIEIPVLLLYFFAFFQKLALW